MFVCCYNARLTLKQCAALKRHRVLPVNRDNINDVANISNAVYISLNLISKSGTGFAVIWGDKGRFMSMDTGNVWPNYIYRLFKGLRRT